MPVVKPVAVHETPKKLIKYILNPDKNEEMKYATGLNCHTDPQVAHEEFREVFENYRKGKFYKSSVAADGKEKILMFHYIQSFKPGECDAELAHKIGIEFAKRVFGENRPVLISTHDDREHIHNHFAVSVYDLEGKSWYDNKTTLRRCREVSDRIAKEYGLSVIPKKKYVHNQRYGDWLHRKKGDSWKVKMAEEIDRIILDSSVRSVDDLIQVLKAEGYEVRQRKYISIRPPKEKHFIRSFRLGDGYSLEALTYRVNHKDTVISDAELMKYQGLQYRYALCLREIQMIMFRRPESKQVTYDELAKTADLLCYIVDNHITSEERFRDYVSDIDDEYRKAEEKVSEMREHCEFEEKLINDSKRFLELWKIPDRTPAENEEMGKYRVLIDLDMYMDGQADKRRAKLDDYKKQLEQAEKAMTEMGEKRKIAADNYSYFLNQMENDFAAIMERNRAEQAQRERQERERQLYNEQLRDNNKTAQGNEPRQEML